MKMEHTLTAPIDGMVAEIAVAADAQVAEGAKVMVIEPVKDSWNSAMPLHLIKLCVGCDSVDDLEDWIQPEAARRRRSAAEARAHPHHPHGAEARR